LRAKIVGFGCRVEGAHRAGASPCRIGLTGRTVGRTMRGGVGGRGGGPGYEVRVQRLRFEVEDSEFRVETLLEFRVEG
jgi:hypothetical protein